MEPISIDELLKEKSLPFDIFNGDGDLVFAKGEQLDSERIAFLYNIPIILKNANPDKTEEKNEVVFSEEVEKLRIKINNKKIHEKYDFMRSDLQVPRSLVDYVNMDNYTGPINKISKIEPNMQKKMKVVFINAIDIFKEHGGKQALELFQELKVKINEILFEIVPEVHKCSELIFLGEYEYCHMINTAIFATILAHKLGYKKEKTASITLAALLHDIGKYRMSETQPDTDHPKIGYEIAKNEFKLSRFISQAIYEHHENNNGSGFPQKLSGNQISIAANIINISSTFDNLLFNRTRIKIKNTREALRAMLSLNTNYFAPNVFYTFIHLFSYNDTMPLEDMLFE